MIHDIRKSLRREMARQGLTQTELARRCGITNVHLCNVLRGHGGVSLELLEQIAEELGCALRITLKKGVKTNG